MDGETLPSATADAGDDERVVLHVDMDCFYASCERLREPELRNEPLVVGMGYEGGENHGAVATASYEAREYGVDSAQPISQALEALPRMAEVDPDDPDAPSPEEAGYYRPVEMEFYKSVAADVKEILHDVADVVREVSVDEAYLDATEVTAWDPVEIGAGDDRTQADSDAAGPADVRRLAEGFARHVKDRIEREAGVPASVGVAPNMSTAKIASDFDKPNGLVVVPPGTVREFLAPLPVEEVHGVGPVTAREMAGMGIDTAGDLAAADAAEVEQRFGERGRELYDRARGDDDREVTPTGLPKSLSRESAFTEATADEAAKTEKVRALAADVAERAKSRGALYRTIGIKVVRPPYDVNTRAKSLSGPVDDPDLVESVALELLEEFDGDDVRKLGVRVSNLDFGESDQATLGGFEGNESTVNVDEDGSTTNADDGSATANAGDGDGTDRGTGEKLTDWVGQEPETTSDGDEIERREPEGQSSLGEFE